MSSIDEVIARSRQKGNFTERKTFTVARQSAIQKMRKFALSDPHYYVLELIQASVANGATYIDLDIKSQSVRLSYVGGGFSESELSQLFDFLFASKDDLDIADARQLALGINALLLAEPDQIVIESGDGTLDGTTRVEIETATDRVTVGTPEKPLRGTFMTVSGINRNRFGAGGDLRETQVIENRCLSATIPIIVNNEPVFGYSTQRIPQLFGYPRSIEIDEGDLYGSIGIATTAYSENFKMLTWGVWIESIKFDLLPGHRLGGIIAFDRLRKTADHGSIVQDEVFAEMWARLRPYARQLIGGRTGAATFNIRTIGSDEKLTAVQIRERIKEAGGAISFTNSELNGPERRALAAEFGDALEVPVFVSSDDESDTVRLLSGEHFLLRPKLTKFELDFYRAELAEHPPRPWVIGAIELEPFTLRELKTWMGARNGILSNLPDKTLTRWMRDLGEPTTEVKSTIFTPTDRSRASSLAVEVRTAGRTVWRGDLASSFPGHTLTIDIPSASPTRLVSNYEGRAVAAYIAEQVAFHATAKLEEATNLALSTLDQRDPEPDSALARITLGALARGTMKRLRTSDDGSQRVVFTVLTDNLDPRALRVPLVRTKAGDPVTCHDLEEMLERQHGIIYGTVPEVGADLEGIDPTCVLDLDLSSERMMVSLVGEGSYVRIDSRDEIARQGAARVRDIYLGAQDAPSLVAEGGENLSDAERRSLITKVLRVYDGSDSRASIDTELRRQASRHLVWYIANRLANSQIVPTNLRDVPLFRAADGRTASFNQISRPLSEGRLRMADGWSIDCADLADLDEAATPATEVDMIAMNPFVYHALRRIGPIHPTMDYAVGAEVEYDGVDMLIEDAFESSHGVGRLGIPARPVPHPAIGLIDSTNQTVGTIEAIAARFGVVGLIHMTEEGSQKRDELARSVRRVCERLIQQLANQFASIETSDEHVLHLLEFAGAAVSLTRQPWGSVELEINGALSADILELPIFPTDHGVAVSAYRFLREFALHGPEDGSVPGRAKLASDAPDYLRGWLDKQLDPGRIHSPASDAFVDEARETFDRFGEGSEAELLSWLDATMKSLRPDELGTPEILICMVEPNDKGRVHLPDARGTSLMGAEQMVGFVDWSERRTLFYNRRHPLVRAALNDPGNKSKRIWLLLAGYAQINYDYAAVTNEHEIEFQSRVLSLL